MDTVFRMVDLIHVSVIQVILVQHVMVCYLRILTVKNNFTLLIKYVVQDL